jgi:hypothetical protein
VTSRYGGTFGLASQPNNGSVLAAGRSIPRFTRKALLVRLKMEQDAKWLIFAEWKKVQRDSKYNKWHK